MSYWRIRFRVTTDLSEPLHQCLAELGALAVSFENAGPDEYYETAYPQQPDWRELNLTGLFPEQSDPKQVMAKVHSFLGRGTACEVSTLRERDWERSWLSGFKPTQVGPRLWVSPSWLPPPAADAVNLIIDPGLAFGTGTHPSTAMCLEWLDRNRPLNKRTVDYGCGSGILAIASLKLGAKHAWGTDIDPRALTSSADNAKRNSVADRYTVCTTDTLHECLNADLVMANILANVLIELRQTLNSLLVTGGIILLAGILREQESKVREAYAPHFDFDQVHHDEWSMLVGYKG